ncbi:hypothetical protein PG987_013696 [Apiospora arundinis]
MSSTDSKVLSIVVQLDGQLQSLLETSASRLFTFDKTELSNLTKESLLGKIRNILIETNSNVTRKHFKTRYERARNADAINARGHIVHNSYRADRLWAEWNVDEVQDGRSKRRVKRRICLGMIDDDDLFWEWLEECRNLNDPTLCVKVNTPVTIATKRRTRRPARRTTRGASRREGGKASSMR